MAKPASEVAAEALRRLDDLGLPPLRALSERLLAGVDAEAAKLCTAVDITVAGAAGPLPARLYAPDAAVDQSAGLIFFHGGGFVFGSLAIYDAFCRRLVAASGLRILSVGYRLAPEAPWPAQHQDAAAAARWTFEHARELGLDPGRVGLGGDSAGAHLALWAAAHLSDRGLKPKAMLLIYPLLTLDDAEWAGPPLESLRVVGRIAVAYIRRQLGAKELLDSALTDSALLQLPPTLLVNGGVDPVRPDAALFAQRLQAAGVRVTTLAYPELIHGSFNLTHLSPAARRAVQETGAVTAALVGG